MTTEFIKNIDWKELQKQKEWLLYEVDVDKREVQVCVLGLIHLIDGLQDYAVDELGIDEDKVFKDINE